MTVIKDDLDSLSRQLYDLHEKQAADFQSELDQKQKEVQALKAKIDALSQVKALVGTGVRSGIQQSIDSGLLQRRWEGLQAEYPGKPILALGRLLMENTDLCLKGMEVQSQEWFSSLLQAQGVCGYISGKVEKERASCAAILGTAARNKRESE